MNINASTLDRVSVLILLEYNLLEVRDGTEGDWLHRVSVLILLEYNLLDVRGVD